MYKSKFLLELHKEETERYLLQVACPKQNLTQWHQSIHVNQRRKGPYHQSRPAPAVFL